jgi:hypothetical protein
MESPAAGSFVGFSSLLSAFLPFPSGQSESNKEPGHGDSPGKELESCRQVVNAICQPSESIALVFAKSFESIVEALANSFESVFCDELLWDTRICLRGGEQESTHYK